MNLEISRRHVIYGLDPKSELKMKMTLTPVPSYDALAFMEHNIDVNIAVARRRGSYGSCSDVDYDFCDINSGRSQSHSSIVEESFNSNNSSPKSDTSLLLSSVEVHPQVAISKYTVYCKVLPPLISVFLTFSLTLLLWPSIVTEIKSFNFPYLEETKWWPLILLCIFAITDCLGRFVVEYRSYVTKDTIWIFALLRFCLVPPIIFCAKGWYFFTNDLWSIVLVSILGMSNGYLGSIAIILVNNYTDTKEETGAAGVFTGFIINVALAMGATVSLCVHNYIF